MGRARLSVVIFLFISIKCTHGQICLNNKSGSEINNQIIAQQLALQRQTNQQNEILNKNVNRNSGMNLVLQNNKLTPQQLGNLQRNVQQPCQQGNIQEQISNRQQSLTNQNCQQTVSLQQSNNAQHQTSLPITNLQLMQTPISTSEMTFSPLPVINNKFAGLPSQVSQGVLLSNLGLTSTLPSLLPNACSVKQALQQQQQQQNIPQNSVSSSSNGPFLGAIDLSQGTIPVSISTSSVQSSGCPCVDDPSTVLTVPLNFQNNIPQQNQQVFELPQTVILMQNQPLQNQNQISATQPVQQQPMQIQSKPVVQVQSQPVVQVQSQPEVPVQSQPAPSIQTQPSLPCFSLTSNTQPYPMSSSGYSSNMVLPQIVNQGSKSSSIKALLPLLFNLLSDKPCCNCHPNNCPCMNPPNNMNNVQQPQILSGYLNPVKVTPIAKEENVVSFENNEAAKVNNMKIKPNDPKDANDGEDDEDDEYYDDFDENSD